MDNIVHDYLSITVNFYCKFSTSASMFRWRLDQIQRFPFLLTHPAQEHFEYLVGDLRSFHLPFALSIMHALLAGVHNNVHFLLTIVIHIILYRMTVTKILAGMCL